MIRSCRRLLALASLPLALVLVIAGCSSAKRAFDLDGAGSGSVDSDGQDNGGKSGSHSNAGSGNSSGITANGDSGSGNGDNSASGDGENGGDSGAGNSSSGPSGSSGSGSVVDCKSAADCEGKDTDCTARTCADGKCGVEYAKDGVAVSAQIAGDCNRTTCDGKGGTHVVADDADLPVDGNICTKDVCTKGVRSNPFEPTTTGCGATSRQVWNVHGCLRSLGELRWLHCATDLRRRHHRQRMRLHGASGLP